MHEIEMNASNELGEHKSSSLTGKKKVLNSWEYRKICDFIQHYHGLAIDCEMEMQKIFPNIERQTLNSILQIEHTTRLRGNYHRFESKCKKYLKTFEQQIADNNDKCLIIKIACMEGISPVALARIILQEKYKLKNKGDISRLLRQPHLIDDKKLSTNVTQCICSDTQDGPLIDMRRRILGEEYEFKLKQKAKAVGMHYYDENDLRRMGFDKTPDIKMKIPFLYNGDIINWIESKATFGDVKTHKWYIQQQLSSYINRFGPGIVVYWFGYHEDTPRLTENNVGIVVLDNFPNTELMEFLNIYESSFSHKPISNVELPEEKKETL